MKFFKVLLLLLTAILCHQSLKALELVIYTVNGIKYTVYEGEAQVRGLANNNIRNVDIPEKVNIDGQSYPVTLIGTPAFQGCSGITTIEDETYRTAILTVPDRSAQLYRNDAVWCKFATIFGGAGIDAPIAADGLDGIDYGSPFEVYSTTGQYIGNDLEPLGTGIYIVRQSNRTAKIRK